MGFLATVGKDFKAVFGWLGSNKGQAVVKGVENVAEVAGTAVGAGGIVQAGINLINNWLSEAIKVETIAASAEQQTGSGVAKAAAVLSTMTPQLASYLQSQGIVSADINSQANAINTAVVNLLNTVSSPSEPASDLPPTTVAPGNPAS